MHILTFDKRNQNNLCVMRGKQRVFINRTSLQSSTIPFSVMSATSATTSPYGLPAPPPPEEDAVYEAYFDNLQLDHPLTPSRFGFALVGVGRAGTIHLSYLANHPEVDLLYIVENDTAKWAKLKNRWNLNTVECVTCEEIGRVFGDPKVRAVVVASPTSTHERLVKGALGSGKAVFCEKPVAEAAEAAAQCYAIAEEAGQPLLCAFNRRFDPAYSAVRARVAAGEIGRVNTVKVCSRDSPLPSLEYLRHSGGIFHDCAVHDIDMVVSMLGEFPTGVLALAKTNIPEIRAIDDFDNVAILLSFDSGAIGIIDLCRHSAFGYDQRLEVFGQGGMIKVENQSPLATVETFGAKRIAKAPIAYSFASRYAEAYRLEMLHFLDVLKGTAAVCVSGAETLAVTRVAAACEQAARTGAAVEIKWAEEDLLSARAPTARLPHHRR